MTNSKFWSFFNKNGRIDFPERKIPVTYRAILESEPGQRVFVKSYYGHTELEYMRGKALFESAQQSGLYRAPEPLKYIEKPGIILWEYLDDLIGFREYLVRHIYTHPNDPLTRYKIVRRIGEIISHIHKDLQKVKTIREYWPISQIDSGSTILDSHVAKCLKSSPLRPVHGDFSVVNLFFINNEDLIKKPVVIDCTTNWYLFEGEKANFKSSIYFDIAQFFYSLQSQKKFYVIIKKEIDDYLSELIEGYKLISGFTLDPATLLACAAEIGILQLEFFLKYRYSRTIGNYYQKRYKKRCISQLFENAKDCLKNNPTQE